MMWIARFSCLVAAAVQSMSGCVAGAGWDRCGAGMSGEARLTAEPLGAGGAADDDRGGHGADALLLEELWGVRLDQGGELCEQFLLFFGDLVDPPQLCFDDPELGAGRQLSKLPGEACSDAWALQCFGAE